MSISTFQEKKNRYKWLLKFPETDYYIKDLKQGSTAYLSVLMRYTEFTGKNPKELIEIARKNIRIAKENLFKFGNFLKNEGLSSRTVRQYLGSKLGRFYKYNMVPIIWTKQDWDSYPDDPVKPKEIKENGIKIEDGRSILRKILRRIKSFRNKAIICAMISSGMDLIDLFKISKYKWDENYDEETNTNIIIYKRVKTGADGAAFFTSESCSYIKDYFKFERKKFQNNKEPIFLTFRKNKEEHEHQHPLNPHTIRQVLNSITAKLSIEGMTQKYIRNLIINNLKRAGFNEEYLNIWIGQRNEMQRDFNTDFIKNLREQYLTVEDLVTIGNGSNKTDLKITALEDQIRELQTEISEIKSELKEISTLVRIVKTYMTRLA